MSVMVESVKFTPGPWEMGFQERELAFVNAASVTIARCDGDSAVHNAHLIAAAPDLYEALAKMMEGCTANIHQDGCVEVAGGGVDLEARGGPCDFCEARAALAKAQGE